MKASKFMQNSLGLMCLLFVIQFMLHALRYISFHFIREEAVGLYLFLYQCIP